MDTLPVYSYDLKPTLFASDVLLKKQIYDTIFFGQTVLIGFNLGIHFTPIS